MTQTNTGPTGQGAFEPVYAGTKTVTDYFEPVDMIYTSYLSNTMKGLLKRGSRHNQECLDIALRIVPTTSELNSAVLGSNTGGAIEGTAPRASRGLEEREEDPGTGSQPNFAKPGLRPQSPEMPAQQDASPIDLRQEAEEHND